jgi:hypothetical protein
MVHISASRRRRSNAPFTKICSLARISVFLVLLLLAFIGLQVVHRMNYNHHPHDNDPHPTILDSGPSTTSRSRHAPQQQSEQATATIAYAVSITGCGSDPISEGAAVLRHSIHRTSIRSNSSSQSKGRYDYKLYAIYHPSAVACARPLAELGYELLERNVLVDVSDIKGDYLRSKIQTNGCCGEKELIKLEAYTLTDHPIVVHLDLDVLILRPLDDLFDLMLQPSGPIAERAAKDIVMDAEHQPLPAVAINAFYTLDYNMVKPQTVYKPVQGGFFVTRPDLAVYEEFRSIVQTGDFQDGRGWGGQVGPFHGSMTFQGILPYYYNYLHPGQSVELNRCVYNQMCDNPRTGKTVNDVTSGECRTNSDECEDCRSRPLEQVVTTHFTLCQKPWWCLPHNQDAIQHRLCRKLTHEWFKIRSELELSWGRSGTGSGAFETEQFYGYCQRYGKEGYIPIQKPYGGPVGDGSET